MHSVRIVVNAIGDTCPLPVVKTKRALEEIKGKGEIETLVDNEIAVQNLTKMAKQKNIPFRCEKVSEKEYHIFFSVDKKETKIKEDFLEPYAGTEVEIEEPCGMDRRDNTVVVISSGEMGEGSKELGATLMKGFIFALTQQEVLPRCILFYNGGAKLTCTGSASLNDLHTLEGLGVEILTCGTCLNFYGIADTLEAGGITNMYEICEKMMMAGKVIKP